MGNRTCSVEGCEEPHNGRGYCAVHYQHWHRWGDPLAVRPPRIRTCAFPGCDNPHDSRGYCSAHAVQLRKGHELKPIRPSWKGAPCTATEECGEPIVARGYCNNHWRAWRKYGDPLISMKQVRGICLFPECGRPHDSHGYCTSHARQLRQGRDVRELLPPGIWPHDARERIARQIEGHAARLGWPRKYTLNETYFDEITDEHRAYWLGFITADGGIAENSAGRPSSLRIELAKRDEGHLLAMCADLGSDRPLLHYRTFASVAFGSRRMADSLGRLGVTPRKSATVQPWDGPADLMPHYWRGLFDGDGCIFKLSTRTDWCLGICGSRACVEAFADWAKGICGGTSKPRHAKGGCWSWIVTGGRKPQLLAEALYADATISLDRKLKCSEVLRSVDFDQVKADANVRKSATMQAAWRNGTHPRSKAAIT